MREVLKAREFFKNPWSPLSGIEAQVKFNLLKIALVKLKFKIKHSSFFFIF